IRVVGLPGGREVATIIEPGDDGRPRSVQGLGLAPDGGAVVRTSTADRPGVTPLPRTALGRLAQRLGLFPGTWCPEEWRGPAFLHYQHGPSFSADGRLVAVGGNAAVSVADLRAR